MCLNTVFLFVLDLGFGRHVVPHPPSIRTHNTGGNRREYMRKGARKLEQCRISGGAEKTMYKHNFVSQRKKHVYTLFLPCSTTSTDKKTVFIHGFVLGRCCAPREKTCLYTVLSFMDKAVFIHSFFGSARNAALRRLLPASCSLLLFPPLVRTAWFPPLAPTDLSHGFSTILAKHKTDQTEPPKHNTHLVFFEGSPK